MKYYDQLLKMGIFCFEDIVNLVGNRKSAASIASAYLKNGYIRKIKRNLYVALALDTREVVVDKFKIGSSITRDAYISHHSAFEFYGVGHQVLFEIYVSTAFEFKTVEFDGIVYRYCASKGDKGVETFRTNRNTRVTNLERTVIDCLKDLDKAGGLEELLQCLRLITFLDEEKLLLYLAMYDIQFLYQKAGYILKHFKEEHKLSDGFFEHCIQHVKNSKRYLTDKNDKDLVYDHDWRLMVPRQLFSFIEPGGTVLV